MSLKVLEECSSIIQKVGVSLMQRCSFRVGVLVVCGKLEFTCSQFLLLLYILDNNQELVIQELVYICLSSGAKGVMILMGSSKTIVWFRRDFRIEDNPALAAAARDGCVFPVFICWFFCCILFNSQHYTSL